MILHVTHAVSFEIETQEKLYDDVYETIGNFACRQLESIFAERRINYGWTIISLISDSDKIEILILEIRYNCILMYYEIIKNSVWIPRLVKKKNPGQMRLTPASTSFNRVSPRIAWLGLAALSSRDREGERVSYGQPSLWSRETKEGGWFVRMMSERRKLKEKENDNLSLYFFIHKTGRSVLRVTSVIFIFQCLYSSHLNIFYYFFLSRVLSFYEQREKNTF